MKCPQELTPDLVQKIKFRKPTRGSRGYDEREVNVLLDRIEKALSQKRPRLTANMVNSVVLYEPQPGQRGYNDDEVDTFLDIVASCLQRRRGRSKGPYRPRAEGKRVVVPSIRVDRPTACEGALAVLAVRALPRAYQARYAEEFGAELAALSEQQWWHRIAYVLRIMRQMWALRRALQHRDAEFSARDR